MICVDFEHFSKIIERVERLTSETVSFDFQCFLLLLLQLACQNKQDFFDFYYRLSQVLVLVVFSTLQCYFPCLTSASLTSNCNCRGCKWTSWKVGDVLHLQERRNGPTWATLKSVKVVGWEDSLCLTLTSVYKKSLVCSWKQHLTVKETDWHLGRRNRLSSRGIFSPPHPKWIINSPSCLNLCKIALLHRDILFPHSQIRCSWNSS